MTTADGERQGVSSTGLLKKALAVSLILYLVVPALVAGLSGGDSRSFEAVGLDEVDYEEVRFRNAEQDVDLAGLLIVPAGEGPFPAAVIIHGSGTSRRDNGWYLTLVDYLKDRGVLVLLPDKRGSGRSEGDWRSASFHDLATDTLAAISYLETREDLAISAIGVIGLSQGGHIAPVVAVESEDVAFVVNMVGGAVPMHDQLVYEETHNLRQTGLAPGLADLLAYPSSWSIIYLRQRAPWEAVGDFDPLPYWERVAIPALVLYGEDDTNVPTRRSAARLRGLGKSNIDVRIYRGSGHALESPAGEGNNIVRRDALSDIHDFIAAAATADEATFSRARRF